MGANGLWIFLPPTDIYAYPAGDKICPEAIGWIKKYGAGACISSGERDELNIGYIQNVILPTGEKLGTGGWVIEEKISSIKLEDGGVGNAAAIKADLRKLDKAAKLEGVVLKTAFLSILSLFKK